MPGDGTSFNVDAALNDYYGSNFGGLGVSSPLASAGYGFDYKPIVPSASYTVDSNVQGATSWESSLPTSMQNSFVPFSYTPPASSGNPTPTRSYAPSFDNNIIGVRDFGSGSGVRPGLGGSNVFVQGNDPKAGGGSTGKVKTPYPETGSYMDKFTWGNESLAGPAQAAFFKHISDESKPQVKTDDPGAWRAGDWISLASLGLGAIGIFLNYQGERDRIKREEKLNDPLRQANDQIAYNRAMADAGFDRFGNPISGGGGGGGDGGGGAVDTSNATNPFLK